MNVWLRIGSLGWIFALVRRNDRALRRQLFEIEDLRAEIAELERGTTTSSEQIEMLRNELALQEKRYVDELAERDRVYAEEIATYRRAVEDIAATPEGLAALTRFNAGEEAEALAVLDRLRAARDLAAARRIAQLALDALRRAKVNTQSVIARYVEITALDPSSHWDWVELGRLQFRGGDLEKALAAARSAAETASTERDRSVAFNELGNVQVAQGNLRGALASYTGSLEIAERLAEDDPGNAGWQRDFWVSMWRLRAFEGSSITWSDIVTKMEVMQARGTLLPTDFKYLEYAQTKATLEKDD
ncbi:MAG: hypothetical protein AAF479_13535 [Pseudomonadota bacterium]